MEISAELGREFDESELLEVGHLAVTIVLHRTKAGLDADLRPFAPYTPEYMAVRADKNLQTSPVDLARTGRMLGAMIPEVTGPGEVTVHQSSEHEAIKAAAHTNGVNKSVELHSYTAKEGEFRTHSGVYATREMHLPQRDFYDVRAPSELDVIAETIGSTVAVRIERLGK